MYNDSTARGHESRRLLGAARRLCSLSGGLGLLDRVVVPVWLYGDGGVLAKAESAWMLPRVEFVDKYGMRLQADYGA